MPNEFTNVMRMIVSVGIIEIITLLGIFTIAKKIQLPFLEEAIN